jgi:hypothetical protein
MKTRKTNYKGLGVAIFASLLGGLAAVNYLTGNWIAGIACSVVGTMLLCE